VQPLQQYYFSDDVITVYKVLEISYVYLILPRSHIYANDTLHATGSESCHVLSSLGRLAEVTSKLIDRRSSTFNWVKFLSSVISGSPLLDTTACASMWSARGHLSARINWLSCDDRRTPPCMRAAGRTHLLFYPTKFATKLTSVSHVRI
jgi:hypothetical protein